MPGWQKLYSELKDKNFEIVSVAQDTGGVKDAAPWITAAKPDFTALIDREHLVTRLYDMVNVPTAVWINEQGRMVRPNEVAYVDNRYKGLHGIDAVPYINGLRDWVANGERSPFALSEQELKERLTPQKPEHARAAAEFTLAEYLTHVGLGADAIPHYQGSAAAQPR